MHAVHRAEELSSIDRLLQAGDFLSPAERSFAWSLVFRRRAMPCEERLLLQRYLAEAVVQPVDRSREPQPLGGCWSREPQRLRGCWSAPLPVLRAAASERLGALQRMIPLATACESRYSADPDAPLGSQRDRDGG